MSKGLLKSINRKNKLYKKYLKKPSLKKSVYKRYKNKLICLLRNAKRLYYEEKIVNAKSNVKVTWKVTCLKLLALKGMSNKIFYFILNISFESTFKIIY